eukprot:15403-Heterococcus_DN1.PRE.3
MHSSTLTVACLWLMLVQQKRLEEEAKRQERDRRKRWLALEEKGDLELSIRESLVLTAARTMRCTAYAAYTAYTATGSRCSTAAASA